MICLFTTSSPLQLLFLNEILSMSATLLLMYFENMQMLSFIYLTSLLAKYKEEAGTVQ